MDVPFEYNRGIYVVTKRTPKGWFQEPNPKTLFRDKKGKIHRCYVAMRLNPEKTISKLTIPLTHYPVISEVPVPLRLTNNTKKPVSNKEQDIANLQNISKEIDNSNDRFINNNLQTNAEQIMKRLIKKKLNSDTKIMMKEIIKKIIEKNRNYLNQNNHWLNQNIGRIGLFSMSNL